MEGQKFGTLTVIKKATGLHWLCLCDCGSERLISKTNLKKCKTKSGNCMCSKNRTKTKLPSGESSCKLLYKAYENNAKKRNIAFKISLNDFKQITKKDCDYCGIEPSNKYIQTQRSNGYYVYNGIDRVDNKKGYILENCVPCCETCNRAKLQMTKKQFIDWIYRVYYFQEGVS